MEIVGSVIDSFICFVVVFIAVTTSIALVHAFGDTRHVKEGETQL